MILIDHEHNTDPGLNLALEEYILRNFDPGSDYFLLYVNRPSVIVGRNQNIFEEINYNYLREKNIPVLRRISGGGTVYHDHGNLNFSFITNYNVDHFLKLEPFVEPIVSVLDRLGVPTVLNARNALETNGLKITGTAQFSSGKKMLSHGTLLFDSVLEEVNETLKVKMDGVESKSHKSVRSIVTNISEHTNRTLSLSEFRQLIIDEVRDQKGNDGMIELTPSEWEEVRELKASKYDTWEWNYGESPKFQVTKHITVDGQEQAFTIWVVKGCIDDITFKSENPLLYHLKDTLTTCRFDKDSLLDRLDQNPDTRLVKNAIAELIFGE